MSKADSAIEDNPNTTRAVRPETEGNKSPARVVARRWRIGVPAALIVLILLAFMPALDAGLVYWDDDDLLLLENRYRNFTWENIRWMFTTSYAGHFQPLTWLSYTLDYAFWRLQPFGYHLTNVALHILTALTFYFVVRRLLAAATGNPDAFRARSFTLAAGWAAALFAIHPLRAESVAWIAERRDVLSGFLYVAAVAGYLRYASGSSLRQTDPQTDSSRGERRFFYALSLGLCLLSLLSKASAMTLPVVLLILDVYPLRRLSIGKAGSVHTGGYVWIEKVPFLFLAAWAGVRALRAQGEGGALYGLGEHDLLARLAQACYGFVFYIWKTVWPTGLGPLYEIPPREVLLGGRLWGSLAAIVVAGFVAVRWRRQLPAIPAALAAYLVILAPVLGFAQSGPQLVADRYSYLACMGFAVLAGAWLRQGLRSGSWWQVAHRRPMLALLSAVLIAVLTHATYRQADIWQSPFRLWRRGVQVSPNSAVAHVNYADALAVRNMIDPAARHYQKALELEPNDPVALHHYADLLKRYGETELAIRHYLRSLQIDPNRSRACLSLARTFVDTGKPELALKALRDGAQRNPGALKLIDYLARLLASHPDASIRNGEEALQWAEHVNRALSYADIPGLTTLATALAEAGRLDEAIATAEHALELAEHKRAGLYANRLRQRLAFFREGKPYHQGP